MFLMRKRWLMYVQWYFCISMNHFAIKKIEAFDHPLPFDFHTFFPYVKLNRRTVYPF